ncbi:MAG: RloB domain-containing protein [Saprospirales bacterium]|nr:RloB domain-containing protein [Saprospirales bacterium]
MKMKNKKAEQKEKKKKHLKTLRAAKARRRGEPVLERSKPTRTPKPTILIVCEGAKTEPSYFRQFRLTSATIKAVGEGYNTLSLVSRAEELMQQDEYDQVWCVFDKDDFAEEDFNNAIAKAEAKGMQVAYSNQAFEYWIILHLENHQGGAMDRSQYVGKINDYLSKMGESFDADSKEITAEIFSILQGLDPQSGSVRRDLAILRAKINFDRFDHSSPAKEESSTAVFLLVEEILKYV